MNPDRTIEPADWMHDPRSRRIMKVLGGLKEDPQALFVGGCVRNALLGKPVTDIDIATRHRPDAVMRLLLNAGIRAIPTGLEHGTVTALLDDTKFEITSLRKDVETDGRHAVIAFADTWEDDAQRRDFTINTLLADSEGNIFDPTGEGLDDIDAGRVRFVGDADRRIAEDYLRILRFFRFHALYSAGEPDAEALEACEKHAEKIRLLSKERITQELLKIIAVRNLPPVLESMFRHGIITALRCEKYNMPTISALCALQSRFEVEDTLGRVYFLCSMDRLGDWLVLSNAQKDHLALIEKSFKALKTISRKKMRELVYLYGNKAVLQGYLVRLAVKDIGADLEMIDIAKYWQAPSFPITGKMLLDQGMVAGPELGKKLKDLETAWIKSDFTKLPKI